MPVLNCYVDDRTFAILEREAAARGRGETPEQLAEAAIEEEAIRSLPRSGGGSIGTLFERMSEAQREPRP